MIPLRTVNPVLAIAIGLVAPPSGKLDVKDQSAPEIAFRSAWLPLTEIKPGECRMLPSPYLQFPLKNAEKREVKDRQGDVTQDAAKGYAYIATASIELKGTKLPFHASLSFEFTDNEKKHFLVKKDVAIAAQFGQCAIATSDSKAVLLLFWETKKATK